MSPWAPVPLTPQPDGSFRATVMAEAGRTSAVVARAWVTVGSTWGGSTCSSPRSTTRDAS